MLVEGWQIVRELLADRLVKEASRHQKWADVSYPTHIPKPPQESEDSKFQYPLRL
jgi:hypothetical protein